MLSVSDGLFCGEQQLLSSLPLMSSCMSKHLQSPSIVSDSKDSVASIACRKTVIVAVNIAADAGHDLKGFLPEDVQISHLARNPCRLLRTRLLG